MPRHDYRCPVCGFVEEIPTKYYDGELVPPICLKCPISVRALMEKLPSAPAVHFKGSGWTPRGNK